MRVAVATAANRLPRSASARIAQIERRQTAMQPPAPPPAATTAPAAMIIQPLGQPPEPPEPASAPEATAAPEPAAAPTADARDGFVADRGTASREAARIGDGESDADPAHRGGARRPAPAAAHPAGPVRASDLEADDPFGAPPPRTPAPRKWVDPFAE